MGRLKLIKDSWNWHDVSIFFWDRFYVLYIIALELVAIIYIIGQYTQSEDKPSFLVALVSLFLSIAAFSTPLLRRPILVITETSPTPSKSGGKVTWFHRLQVTNLGLAPAENCVGKLLQVETVDGKRIEKFDPVFLYWPRQGPEFAPVTIFARNDFDYLDVFREGAGDGDPKRDGLRIHTPKRRTLIQGETDAKGKGPNSLKPGTYYLKIGVFANNGQSKAEWFTLNVTEEVTSSQASTFQKGKQIASSTPNG